MRTKFIGTQLDDLIQSLKQDDGIDDRGEEWLTVKDICKELQVHPNTAYRWIKSGQLKAYRITVGENGKNCYRIKRDDFGRVFGDEVLLAVGTAFFVSRISRIGSNIRISLRETPPHEQITGFLVVISETSPTQPFQGCSLSHSDTSPADIGQGQHGRCRQGFQQ